MKKVKEMLYHIGFKVKIYPSNEQKHLIAVNRKYGDDFVKFNEKGGHVI